MRHGESQRLSESARTLLREEDGVVEADLAAAAPARELGHHVREARAVVVEEAALSGVVRATDERADGQRARVQEGVEGARVRGAVGLGREGRGRHHDWAGARATDQRGSRRQRRHLARAASRSGRSSGRGRGRGGGGLGLGVLVLVLGLGGRTTVTLAVARCHQIEGLRVRRRRLHGHPALHLRHAHVLGRQRVQQRSHGAHEREVGLRLTCGARERE